VPVTQGAAHELAAELKLLIRLAPKRSTDLAGRIPALCELYAVESQRIADDATKVRFVVHRLIPEYLERLPAGRDCLAIRELFAWDAPSGEARSLASRYTSASRHLLTSAKDFARRQEGRLLLECARHFLRFDDLDMIKAAQEGPEQAPLVDRSGLNPLAQVLWSRAVEEQERRVAAIREGEVDLRDQAEVLGMLVPLTDLATRTVHAVDQTRLERWFGDYRLRRYLRMQMKRAANGELQVERIRVVREREVQDARDRNLLREFMRIHRQAGAELYLCPEHALTGFSTDFNDRLIMVLIDSEAVPACMVSELDDRGYIRRSTVYLRSSERVRRYLTDFREIARHVADLDEAGDGVEAVLERHDDPPLAATPPTESQSPWWPLGAPT
jgi:hypothetical protein